MGPFLHGDLHFGGIVGRLFMPPLKEAGIIAFKETWVLVVSFKF